MAYVSVPKDLTHVKSKMLFGLTKRQIVPRRNTANSSLVMFMPRTSWMPLQHGVKVIGLIGPGFRHGETVADVAVPCVAYIMQGIYHALERRN